MEVNGCPERMWSLNTASSESAGHGDSCSLNHFNEDFQARRAPSAAAFRGKWELVVYYRKYENIAIYATAINFGPGLHDR
jgi:hypothetical protein